jgi:hypothetical protein
MNKYPEAVSVVQQLHKVLIDTEILGRYTPAKEVVRSEWTKILNSAEENRGNFCKILDGKPLDSALYGMHTVNTE